MPHPSVNDNIPFTKLLKQFLANLFGLTDGVETAMKRVTGPNEVVPNVPKPSIILVDMIGLKLLEKPEIITLTSYPRDSDRKKLRWYSANILVEGFLKYRYSKMEYIIVEAVAVGKEKIDLTDYEKERLQKKLVEAYHLKDEADKVRAEAARQQKAVNLIENFFKSKEPVPVIDSKLMQYAREACDEGNKEWLDSNDPMSLCGLRGNCPGCQEKAGKRLIQDKTVASTSTTSFTRFDDFFSPEPNESVDANRIAA